MVRAQTPRRAEFGACGCDDEQGRLRAAFGEGAQEVERRRVRPVEVFEGEHYR